MEMNQLRVGHTPHHYSYSSHRALRWRRKASRTQGRTCEPSGQPNGGVSALMFSELISNTEPVIPKVINYVILFSCILLSTVCPLSASSITAAAAIFFIHIVMTDLIAPRWFAQTGVPTGCRSKKLHIGWDTGNGANHGNPLRPIFICEGNMAATQQLHV
jgi:hypothetical protein